MRENTLQKSALRDLGISNRFTKSHGYNLGRRKNLSTAFYEKLLYSSDKNKFSRHIVTVPFKQGANVVVRLLRLCFLTAHPFLCLTPNFLFVFWTLVQHEIISGILWLFSGAGDPSHTSLYKILSSCSTSCPKSRL